MEKLENGAVAGRNAVRELLRSGRDIDKIFVKRGEREGSITQLISDALSRKIPVIHTEAQKLDALAGGVPHQGIVAIASETEYCTVQDIIAAAREKGEKPFVVVADGIEDPHNLGAVIRSAHCSGAHGIIIPKRHSAGVNQTVAKASAGSLEYMPIAKVPNIPSAIEELKREGLWIYGADMGGSAYYDTDMDSSIAVVLGAEGSGISRLVREKCDFLVSIPIYGKIDSLNVSAAAAVIFSEIARQQRGKKSE